MPPPPRPSLQRTSSPPSAVVVQAEAAAEGHQHEEEAQKIIFHQPVRSARSQVVLLTPGRATTRRSRKWRASEAVPGQTALRRRNRSTGRQHLIGGARASASIGCRHCRHAVTGSPGAWALPRSPSGVIASSENTQATTTRHPSVGVDHRGCNEPSGGSVRWSPDPPARSVNQSAARLNQLARSSSTTTHGGLRPNW